MNILCNMAVGISFCIMYPFAILAVGYDVAKAHIEYEIKNLHGK